jgi:hypothetical protein
MASIKDFVAVSRALKPRLPANTKKYLQKIKELYNLIEKFEQPEELNSTPKEIIDLTDFVNNNNNLLNYLSSVAVFSPVYNLQNEKDCIEDLEAIAKETEDFKVVIETLSLSFKLRVKMKDVFTDSIFDFGYFRIIMRHSDVIAQPAGENTERGGYYHPYIRANLVCLGEYLEPYQLMMKSCQYFSAYTLVKQCLTLYGGNDNAGTAAGPYQMAITWIGQPCSVCDETVQPEDTTVCGKSNRPICPKCVDTGICNDENDGENYHPDVLKVCDKCGKRTSTVIRGVCLNCRRKDL